MKTIGAAAQAAGLPTKTVRYYADVGLVEPTQRSDKGYRLYQDPDIRKLQFVRQARSFGFSVDACRELLSLYQSEERTSREVKQIAQARLAELEAKMAELGELHQSLSALASVCRGDDQSECPIITSLASGN